MTTCGSLLQNVSSGTNETVQRFIVEETSVYTVYQACFVAIYFLLAAYCFYTVSDAV